MRTTGPRAGEAAHAAIDATALDAEIGRVGRVIAEAERHPGLRRPVRAIEERASALAARDAELRAAIFRLVDVTPACRSPEDVGRHLASFASELHESGALAAAMRVAQTRPGRALLGSAVAAGVRHTAHRFIAGRDPRDAAAEIGELWREGIAASLDLLGEATVSSQEADSYAARCAEALDALVAAAADWPSRPPLEQDSSGAIPRANLSVKVSSLTALVRPQAPERGAADAAGRLRPLLERASAAGAHLHIDTESLDSLETTFELTLGMLAEERFTDGPSAGVVVQAYLRDSPALVERILEWAAAHPRSSPLIVRLVKGAYWDHEVAESGQHGWHVPVFTDKAECDRNFERLTRRLLDARPLVRVAIGSHNLRSIAHAVAWNRLSGGAEQDLEVQVLRGLGDELAGALAQVGLRVRVYSPVGELVAGMAYLVRRLLENTANESFLLAQAEGVPLERLLAAP
jgi:proline dehydrogenase